VGPARLTRPLSRPKKGRASERKVKEKRARGKREKDGEKKKEKEEDETRSQGEERNLCDWIYYACNSSRQK
jgi:hypothetical protein